MAPDIPSLPAPILTLLNIFSTPWHNDILLDDVFDGVFYLHFNFDRYGSAKMRVNWVRSM